MRQSMDNRLIVKLDTIDYVPAELSLQLAGALLQQLRASPGLRDATIVIEELGVGSWWVHLLLVLGAIGTFAEEAPKLIDSIRKGEGPFGLLVGPSMDRHQARTCQVVAGDTDVIIMRDEIATPKIVETVGTARGTSRAEAFSETQQAHSRLTGRFVERIDMRSWTFETFDGAKFSARLSEREDMIPQIGVPVEVTIFVRPEISEDANRQITVVQIVHLSAAEAIDAAARPGGRAVRLKGRFFGAQSTYEFIDESAKHYAVVPRKDRPYSIPLNEDVMIQGILYPSDSWKPDLDIRVVTAMDDL